MERAWLDLIHAPSRIVQALSIGEGLADDPSQLPLGDWPSGAGTEADKPDDFISFYDTAGYTDGGLAQSGEAVDFHGLAVRVRSRNRDRGFAKATALRSALLALKRQETQVEGETYLVEALRPTGPVVPLVGPIQSARKTFGFDLLASITRR